MTLAQPFSTNPQNSNKHATWGNKHVSVHGPLWHNNNKVTSSCSCPLGICNQWHRSCTSHTSWGSTWHQHQKKYPSSSVGLVEHHRINAGAHQDVQQPPTLTTLMKTFFPTSISSEERIGGEWMKRARLGVGQIKAGALHTLKISWLLGMKARG